MTENAPSDHSAASGAIESLPADLARSLLARLATPEAMAVKDARGLTPLMRAILDNDAELTAFLAPRSHWLALQEIEMERPGGGGWRKMSVTPLMLAARLDFVDCARALLATGKAREQCELGGGPLGMDLPALDQAVSLGNAECVKLLAPLSNLKNRQRLLPLIEAARMGRLDLVEALAPWCNAASRAADGQSALHAAVSSKRPGCMDCFRFLLALPEVKASLAPDKTGWRPGTQMFLDAIKDDNAEAMRLLAPYFDMNERMRERFATQRDTGAPPLLWAAESHSPKCVEAMLPWCDATLEARRESAPGEALEPTPLEKAWGNFETGQNPGAALQIADAIAARLMELGRDPKLPKFAREQSRGEAIPLAQMLEKMPKTRAAIEAQALRNEMRAPNGAAQAGSGGPSVSSAQNQKPAHRL